MFNRNLSIPTRAFSFVLSMILLALPLAAQDGEHQMNPEMMKKWMEAATPGEPHAKLARMEGEWVESAKSWWSGDDAEPMTHTGEHSAKMILGGRWLQMSSKATVMNMPWEGTGFMGYENISGKYTMIWIDNMGTELYACVGTADRTGNVITMFGKMDEPMTGERDKMIKYVWTWIDDDTHRFEIYDLVGTPDEFKAMESTYSRQQ